MSYDELIANANRLKSILLRNVGTDSEGLAYHSAREI